MKIELHGVEVFGHHGATEAEEREGQTFLFDIALWPRQEPDADDIERTIDYREVAACVREVSDRERVRLLETLAGEPGGRADQPLCGRARPCARAQAAGPARPARRALGRHRRTAVTTTYVGLGSNLGDREHAIRSAAELIGADEAVRDPRDGAVGL